MGSAPPSVSSAGCRRRRTVRLAGMRARTAGAKSTAAVPRSMTMWPSCPQACMRPSLRDLYGTSFSSVIGSPSMSARRAMHFGPGASETGPVPAMSATSPVPAVRLIAASGTPRRVSTSTILADVSNSLKASSGFM
eukprot:Amastigsp_a339553_7.p3 type:complete len:136 gc:universal Amastigsp_a339553_7:547-140(-)